MFGFLNNLPQVTKNILLLNIMFYAVTYILEMQGINLVRTLGVYNALSPLFAPFQIVTHFFMHGGFFHIFFNMWLFVMLGGYLEKIWGEQRFFIFYVSCAMGALILYNAFGFNELLMLKDSLSQSISISDLDYIIANSEGLNTTQGLNELNQKLRELIPANSNINPEDLKNYIDLSMTPMVGASGAIFGVMAAFAILFPNTEFYLYFAIPVKAKYLVGLYFIYEVYMSLEGANDGTAHLAHVGGAIVGAVFVFFWRKKDRNNFY